MKSCAFCGGMLQLGSSIQSILYWGKYKSDLCDVCCGYLKLEKDLSFVR